MVPKDIKYNQSHATIYEQEEAVGHSVRAVYMYTAMADLAATEHDEKLFAACERLWNNMTEKEDVYNRRYRLKLRGAYERGPFVYCFEGVDNDSDVQSLILEAEKDRSG